MINIILGLNVKINGIVINETDLFRLDFINAGEKTYAFKLFDPIHVNEMDENGNMMMGRKMIKPATFLVIKLDDSEGRFSTYISCGENKIYIQEHTYLHELQITIRALKLQY